MDEAIQQRARSRTASTFVPVSHQKLEALSLFANDKLSQDHTAAFVLAALFAKQDLVAAELSLTRQITTLKSV